MIRPVNHRKILTAALLILLASAQLYAKLNVQTYLKRSIIYEGGLTAISVRVSYKKEDSVRYIISPPKPEIINSNLILKRSPQNVRTLISNDNSYVEKSFDFILQAQSTGVYKIAPIEMDYFEISEGSTNARTYKSRSLMLHVNEAPNRGDTLALIIKVLIGIAAFFILGSAFAVFYTLKNKRKQRLKKEAAAAERRAENQTLYAMIKESSEYEYSADYLQAFSLLCDVLQKLLKRKDIENITDIDKIESAGLIEGERINPYREFIEAYKNFKYGKVSPERGTLDFLRSYTKDLLERIVNEGEKRK